MSIHPMHLAVMWEALVQPLYCCVTLEKLLNLLAYAPMGTQFMILDLFPPQIYIDRTAVMRAMQ